MTDHTPGPWRLARHGAGQLVFSDEGRDEVGAHAYVAFGVDNPADARLIASAPELLAERDTLRTVNADLVKLLETVEWAGSQAQQVCPVCEYRRTVDQGHAKDCELADALDRARGLGQNLDVTA